MSDSTSTTGDSKPPVPPETPTVTEPRPRVLMVTGRLAEFALRRELDALADRLSIDFEVAVLPITVAALMPVHWVARHLEIPERIDRVVLPGLCRGDLEPLHRKAPRVSIERGPEDLRDLAEFFGLKGGSSTAYDPDGPYSIEILAEINHAAQIGRDAIIEQAEQFIREGADRIDLGCDPGGPWFGVGDAVRALRDRGIRVSIDSFDPTEVVEAVRAGADLVLSVNGSNREQARDWGVEVVAVPDSFGTLDGLEDTYNYLRDDDVTCRLDPIVEPIGFGFARSLGRYLEVRDRFPDAEMMMGIGNLSELTDVDTAGVNMLLIGFCQELRIGSVLTTSVINWAHGSVAEIDVSRRLAHHAVTYRTLPKHLDSRLIALRDRRIPTPDLEGLRQLQRQIKDPNWRIFAEGGRIYAINNHHFLDDDDPYALFDRMGVDDPEHAFYLGSELMKAKTALTLQKEYRQDQALDWGYLTEPEISALERRKKVRGPRKARPRHSTTLHDSFGEQRPESLESPVSSQSEHLSIRGSEARS